jgi:hypothetical protein
VCGHPDEIIRSPDFFRMLCGGKQWLTGGLAQGHDVSVSNKFEIDVHRITCIQVLNVAPLHYTIINAMQAVSRFLCSSSGPN